MNKRHQPTGRNFWESYVVLNKRVSKNYSNTLIINLGADDPHLLTLPKALEFVKKVAKKEGFNRLVKVEEDIRVYGQNNLAERLYYFKKGKKTARYHLKNQKKERKRMSEDRFDEQAQIQVIFPKDKKEKVSAIFNPEPEQWGLRGDSFLWEDLKKEFDSIELPCSKSYFTKVFEEKFEKLTNQRFRTRKYVEIYVKEYDNGGMINGQVSMKFWKKVGLPLLLERLEEKCKNK